MWKHAIYSVSEPASLFDALTVPAAEAREAEARIREAQQKHQELESERQVLRHKALASRAAEQVRPGCPGCPYLPFQAQELSCHSHSVQSVSGSGHQACWLRPPS